MVSYTTVRITCSCGAAQTEFVSFTGSHPNDGDAHFRLTEEQMFTSIFAYADHLFGKIKPKKLFFMAIDGVAPRAKMNQQRSRRFRTSQEAKEKEEAHKEAIAMWEGVYLCTYTPHGDRLLKPLQYSHGQGS